MRETVVSTLRLLRQAMSSGSTTAPNVELAWQLATGLALPGADGERATLVPDNAWSALDAEALEGADADCLRVACEFLCGLHVTAAAGSAVPVLSPLLLHLADAQGHAPASLPRESVARSVLALHDSALREGDELPRGGPLATCLAACLAAALSGPSREQMLSDSWWGVVVRLAASVAAVEKLLDLARDALEKASGDAADSAAEEHAAAVLQALCTLVSSEDVCGVFKAGALRDTLAAVVAAGAAGSETRRYGPIAARLSAETSLLLR